MTSKGEVSYQRDLLYIARELILFIAQGRERQLSRDCYPQELTLLLERVREIAGIIKSPSPKTKGRPIGSPLHFLAATPAPLNSNIAKLSCNSYAIDRKRLLLYTGITSRST
jgi:hypothetical protein